MPSGYEWPVAPELMADFVSFEDLMKLKADAGRPKDLQDIYYLRQINIAMSNIPQDFPANRLDGARRFAMKSRNCANCRAVAAVGEVTMARIRAENGCRSMESITGSNRRSWRASHGTSEFHRRAPAPTLADYTRGRLTIQRQQRGAEIAAACG